MALLIASVEIRKPGTLDVMRDDLPIDVDREGPEISEIFLECTRRLVLTR
jgi:hypothetical protein